MFQIEVVDEYFNNSEIFRVLRINQRGDLVLDTKPRKYIEFVSQMWGREDIQNKNKAGDYSWIESYIKTSKDYHLGYVRRIADEKIEEVGNGNCWKNKST